MGSSIVYAGQSTVEEAHGSLTHDGSGVKMGDELRKIGYVGDGPNTFEEFPISAHFEIHVEQADSLEKAGKPVGWVTGWQGMTWCRLIPRNYTSMRSVTKAWFRFCELEGRGWSRKHIPYVSL